MKKHPLIFSAKPATPEIGRFRKGFAVVAMTLGAAATGFMVGRATAETPDRPADTVTYFAQQGDTNWDIANKITDGDPRPVVAELEDQRREAGDNNPNIVRIGEAYKVPADSPLGEEVQKNQDQIAQEYGSDSDS